MAWFTVIVGGIILIVGLLGQIFGISKSKSSQPEDRRIGKLVFTIGSVVVGLWVIAFATARLLHFKSTGHW